ncbi:hypothetical protein PLICRDRAFT_51630 [Plicaturopsis crispa FD-325 SS-3]|nr:hypothetical protein PLICRDRAFT_51630 [Plicaturopsis crispa FD-325 SS-3]
MSHGMNKITVERNQRAVLELVAQPGNDVCADCKARAPRWASHNLGIFICVSCASVHRKMGTHISKVKSVTLDSWTKEQVESMRQNGNVKSNAFYNPNETRHPPPTNMMESERDSELELYIRAKYQYKKFIDRSKLVASHLGPSQSSSVKRPQSTPIATSTPPAPSPASAPAPISNAKPTVPANTLGYGPSLGTSNVAPRSMPQPPVARSVSQPLSSQFKPPQPPQKPSNNPLWDDLISLQGPAQSSTLPLQVQATSMPNTNPYANFAGNPAFTPQQTGVGSSPAFGGMGMMNTGMSGNTNPFQYQGQPAPFAPSGSTNPFNQSGGFGQVYPSATGAGGSFGSGMMTGNGQATGSGPFAQPQQAFMSSQPQVQSPLAMQTQQTSFFQPQPQAQSIQPQPFSGSPSAFGGGSPSPYLQTGQQQPMNGGSPSPYGQQPVMNQQPNGGSPSPYMQQPFAQQPSPFAQQPQQQPQQQTFNPSNPFVGWAQNPQPGYPQQQQQWGGGGM